MSRASSGVAHRITEFIKRIGGIKGVELGSTHTTPYVSSLPVFKDDTISDSHGDIMRPKLLHLAAASNLYADQANSSRISLARIVDHH
jgi:hypothetical protein